MLNGLEPPASPADPPSPLGGTALVAEIKQFLENLGRDFPQIFPVPPAKRPPAVRRIPYRGAELELRVARESACELSTVLETEGGLTIVRSENDGARPADLLREWYRRKAGEVFARRAAHWSAAMGVGYSRIRIRDQRTLWGSCSREGSLSFNWRLVMAPPEVLDYLVIHELAHLLEMNHSRRFWRHVSSWCPDYRGRRRWLREHSRELKSRLRRPPQ